MRKNKKAVTAIVAIVLVLAVAITLVACGNKNTTSNTTNEGSQGATTQTDNGTSSNANSKNNYDGLFLGWLPASWTTVSETTEEDFNNLTPERGKGQSHAVFDGVKLAQWLEENLEGVDGYNRESLTFVSSGLEFAPTKVVLFANDDFESEYGDVEVFSIVTSATFSFVRDGETVTLSQSVMSSNKLYWNAELGVLSQSEGKALKAKK